MSKESETPPDRIGVGPGAAGYHQPGRSLGHDFAGSTAQNQSVSQAGGFEPSEAGFGGSLRGGVLLTLGAHERHAGLRGRPLRASPPRSNRSLPESKSPAHASSCAALASVALGARTDSGALPLSD